MAGLRSLLPTGRSLVLVDVVVAMWVALWIGLGLAVAAEVRDLRRLSGTAVRVGAAVEETGNTLETIGRAPLIGDRVAQTGHDIASAGQSVATSGRESRTSIHRLSWMLGLILAVLPTLPLLLLYVPSRVAAERERRALKRLLAERRDDPVLVRLLAQRALLASPYRQLLDADGEPLDQARDDRLQELADSELSRLGLTRGHRR